MQKQNELIRYLKLCYRHRYIFITVSLLVMTVVTVYGYFLPKKYEADSTVFIEENIINRLVEGIAMTPDISDQIKVLNVALLSRDIITKVLEDIDSEIFTKSNSEQQAFITSLRERVNIRVKGRELFTVSLVDSDPAFAQTFVNTLVSKYVEENISAKRDESYGANRFLVEQLEMFKKKLDAAENAIIEFRKKQGIYLSLDEQGDLDEIRAFMREGEDIELELQTIKARYKSLQNQLSGIDETVDIYSATSDDRIVELERQLNNLLLRYTENYPEVIRVKAEIEGLKKLKASSVDGQVEGRTRTTSLNPLFQEVQQQVFELEAEISSLEAKKDNIKRLIDEREKSLRDVPAAKKELAILIQERDSHRKIYQELLARMGQSEVTKQMEISDKASTFRIVDPANFPEVPVSPNMVRMLLMAIAGGLGCGFGIVVFLDSIDDSVNDPSYFDDLGVEVLAMIPNISNDAVNAQINLKDKVFYAGGSLYFSVFLLLLVAEFFHLI